MADHFALMTGRLLTESTLQSAVHEAFADAVASTAAGPDHDQTDPSAVPEDVQLGMGMGMGKGKAKSGVMVECRICQEEDLLCSHKKDEKKTTIQSTVLNDRTLLLADFFFLLMMPQQLKPNYTAPLFRHGRNLINLRAAGEIRENPGASYGHTSDQADGASSVDSQSPNLKGVIYCQVVAIALMVLLVLRDAILLILHNHEVCSVELITNGRNCHTNLHHLDINYRIVSFVQSTTDL
ncbi:unnamed protein product [Miscanthus lutarioriparius]|uniref:Uncharacterized protein n=1 Tax=Miscanthus lutarioriparius TaxID=422564 RepID=A0A811NXB7_9POAL|nr:unnamed protein product [Miscanthus lutarioriparius]